MAVFARTTVPLAAAVAATALAWGLAAEAGSETYGLRPHVDAKYGFSFWYPKGERIKVSAQNEQKSFPGGLLVETIQVGEPGAVSIHVVESPQHTITDEPNGHASPLAQMKYDFNESSRTWMLTYPEGNPPDGGRDTRPADISETTVGGLPMLPSTARFDTTIIPLSTTRFLVVQDGGGSAITHELAKTAAKDARVDPAAQTAALQALAAAHQKENDAERNAHKPAK